MYSHADIMAFFRFGPYSKMNLLWKNPIVMYRILAILLLLSSVKIKIKILFQEIFL